MEAELHAIRIANEKHPYGLEMYCRPEGDSCREHLPVLNTPSDLPATKEGVSGVKYFDGKNEPEQFRCFVQGETGAK
jgi:hypothetical protein